jgi:hypothetical protein
MLVGAHAGGINHHQFAVEAGGNRCQQPVPHTSLPPADEPVVAGGRWAKAFRDFRPGRTRAEAPENAVQDTTIVNPRPAARLVGQQWLDDQPFLVRQFVSPPRHAPSIYEGRLNHDYADTSTPIYEFAP